jgi:hypothetical protein
MPYLRISAPERFPMTAGASLVRGMISDGTEPDLWAPINEMLDKRLKQTV